MHTLFADILRRLQAGERLALCTVVAARGSTPQGAGARMIVTQAGQTVGTLGGGCVEAEVRKRSLNMLLAGDSGLLNFRLDHDYGWDDGLICGGAMDIFVQSLSTPAHAAPFADILSSLARREPAAVRISYQAEGSAREFSEELRPDPVLVIAGAGHVGQALARFAAPLGFAVTIIDDRPDYACPERFPTAARFIVQEIEPALAALSVDADTSIVIVTRGHRHDGRALEVVVQSPAGYIGLIGSKRKILTILGDLARAGVPTEALLRVRAPIGLAIGAITPEEIALAIAAELTAIRRHCPVAGMQIDRTVAAKAIARALATPS